ncbi:MAG TPA: ABC transporter ATP-binding protein [Candidatus Ligilactobacillus avistercoris]|nr:ABC transporter ATP-binding protein [Candidatus Ligilactobacillus avistercoris]
MEVVKMTGVTKFFGKQQVLQNVALTVSEGEIVGLLGPSGAGKSTMIMIILGMLRGDKGTVRVFNQPMPNRKLLNKIGYMAQSDALYEQLSGKENLAFFAELKGISRHERGETISHVATIVGLTDQLEKRVKDYSGGMKRRLSLAIAMLGNPALLVLDEPTVGIDPILSQSIWKELRRLQKQGTAILITTHIMAEAELVDRVALLRDGWVIANDTPSRLMTRYHANSIEAVFMKAEVK